MSIKISKTAEQIGERYHPIGQKGHPPTGNDIDQDSEVAEEINEDMEVESKEQEFYTPGTDNIIIDKMDSAPINEGTVLAQLEILLNDVKVSYARDLIEATIKKIKKG
jgi:hypothetical protein